MSAKEFLRSHGIDVGDDVVIVLRSGLVITGELVAAFDRFIRVRVTEGDRIPENTILTINVGEIAAAGEDPSH